MIIFINILHELWEVFPSPSYTLNNHKVTALFSGRYNASTSEFPAEKVTKYKPAFKKGNLYRKTQENPTNKQSGNNPNVDVSQQATEIHYKLGHHQKKT